jgi:hypothetical protein
MSVFPFVPIFFVDPSIAWLSEYGVKVELNALYSFMIQARQVSSDVKFPLSLINTYQLDKHHPEGMKLVLLSQGIALELASIV